MAKKKRKRAPHFNPNIRDVHHILYQDRHWTKPWEKRLRNHEYCKISIPRDTLHHAIHEFVGDVPAPGDQACKIAYEAIESWLRAGYISLNDPLQARAEALRKCFAAKYPATAAALAKQVEIAKAYYSKQPQ